jgi:Kef-type K+ transport system membrane component KefB
MQHLQHADVAVMLLALGVLLGSARLLGELAQRLHQPAVVGEILAGVLLGPTVLGHLAPTWYAFLFPPQGPNAVFLEGISTLSIVLFLLVAGMEVDLSTVWRQGKVAVKVGLVGMIVPFVLGLVGAWLLPGAWGRPPHADAVMFALFFGTALAISALPVIAKTLMDLNLYRTDLGMVVVSAAVFNDLIGWTVFGLILGMMEGARVHGLSAPVTVGLTLLYAAVMLTAGRGLIHRALPYLQAYTHSPDGILAFAMTLALIGAACTELIGVHAIFGSFLVGVAVGDSSHLRERTRAIIHQFVSFIFAPVFFASIGLRVNFLTHFDAPLVVLVSLIACVGKLAGAAWGGRWAGVPARDRWAIAFAMNARGAMEIILGLLALEAGVIGQPLFVALVVMALVTSMISGPAMRWILQPRRARHLFSVLSAKRFRRSLAATTRGEAIHELMTLVQDAERLDPRHSDIPTGGKTSKSLSPNT